MSSKLVTKMRKRIHDATNSLPSSLNWEDLLAEAADEIERLADAYLKLKSSALPTRLNDAP